MVALHHGFIMVDVNNDMKDCLVQYNKMDKWTEYHGDSLITVQR